jgi:hypothetical protein
VNLTFSSYSNEIWTKIETAYSMFIRNRVENPFLFLSKMQPRAIKSVFYVNSDLKQNYDRNEIVFLKVSLETQQKLNPVYINRALTKNAVVLLVSRPSTLMFFGCGWLVAHIYRPYFLLLALWYNMTPKMATIATVIASWNAHVFWQCQLIIEHGDYWPMTNVN